MWRLCYCYSHYSNIIHSFEEHEHYKEIEENKEINGEKYTVSVGLMWDDEPNEDIRVIVKIKKKKGLLMSKSVSSYFVINSKNEIKYT